MIDKTFLEVDAAERFRSSKYYHEPREYMKLGDDYFLEEGATVNAVCLSNGLLCEFNPIDKVSVDRPISRQEILVGLAGVCLKTRHIGKDNGR